MSLPLAVTVTESHADPLSPVPTQGLPAHTLPHPGYETPLSGPCTLSLSPALCIQTSLWISLLPTCAHTLDP